MPKDCAIDMFCTILFVSTHEYESPKDCLFLYFILTPCHLFCLFSWRKPNLYYYNSNHTFWKTSFKKKKTFQGFQQNKTSSRSLNHSWESSLLKWFVILNNLNESTQTTDSTIFLHNCFKKEKKIIRVWNEMTIFIFAWVIGLSTDAIFWGEKCIDSALLISMHNVDIANKRE